MEPSGLRLHLLFRGPREEHLVNKDGFVEAFSSTLPLIVLCCLCSLGKGRDGLLCFASRIPLSLGGEVGNSSLSLCQFFLMLTASRSLGPWHCRPLQGISATCSLLYREEAQTKGVCPPVPAPFQSSSASPGPTRKNRLRRNWVT